MGYLLLVEIHAQQQVVASIYVLGLERIFLLLSTRGMGSLGGILVVDPTLLCRG